MDAGHSGSFGHFQQYREIAFEYAFLLDLADSWKLLSTTVKDISTVDDNSTVDEDLSLLLNVRSKD